MPTALEKVATLFALLAHTLIAIILILIDALVPLPLCAFPRTPEEAQRSRRLMRLLADWCGFGAAHTLRLAPRATNLEPDKAPSRAPLIVVHVPTGEVVERLFVKCGSAFSRGLPLWLTALASYSGNQEVLFYRRVRRLLPPGVHAPRADVRR